LTDFNPVAGYQK